MLGAASPVTLNERTAFAVRQWLAERQILGGRDDGLWLTKQGKRLSVSGIAFVIKRIGWQAKLRISVEMLRRTWLAKSTDLLNKDELVANFGSYVSEATINRYGISLPVESDLTPLEQ
jgi:site-specific recombinase XerC